MPELSWTSLLPSLLAIGLALFTRQVYLSLAGGVWLGWTIALGWNPVAGLGRAIDATVAVLASEGDAKVILFTLVIGALIATLEAAGGVQGFVRWLEERRFVTSARRAQALAWLIGVIVFVESNITVLVAGAVARPLFDRFRCSREKLAFLIDSTSAPVCILIPLNAWGAYNLALLGGLGVEDPVDVFLHAVVLNFYPLAAVALAAATVFWGIDLGPMRKAEARTREGLLHWPQAQLMVDETVLAADPDLPIPPRARNMVIPVAVMVGAMPIGLYVTGDGNLMRGSGSTSVLWAVLAALAAAWGLLLAQRGMNVQTLTHHGLKGAGALVPMALVMLLALALGTIAKELGAGHYVAGLVANKLAPVVLLPAVFLVGAAIAFSIGSSWGTFAIMLPIAVPAAEAMGLPFAPFVAAALSGGVFGDHASPISDTTIIASMAAATDHIDHVRTQLPYALCAGAVALVGFAILGTTL